MSKPLRIAMLIPDNRDEFRQYDRPDPVFGPAPEALLLGLAELPEVEVHVIACTQRPLVAPERIARNVFYHSLLVSKLGWLRTGYQGCIRAVRRKIRLLRPQLVHGQGTERYCAMAAVLSGLPNVLTIHGNMREVARIGRARPFSFPWCAARLERLTLPRTHGVVCITTYTQRLVSGLAPRTWVVPNAVHPSFFDVSRRPSNAGEILVVGQICERKNQNALIEALTPVADGARFTLVFLGGADDRDPFVVRFRQLVSARPWCRHAGLADRKTLQMGLSTCAMLVLPSLEDNCPMVILEAAASGVPVAAARVGGVPDLIEDRRTGVLFTPTDQLNMAEAVGSLLRNPGEAARLAITALGEARTRFHPRVIAQAHLRLYQELLTQAATSSGSPGLTMQA